MEETITNIIPEDVEQEIDIEVENVVLGGTSNYNELLNKPAINNIELTGNKTAEELGLQPKGDYAFTEYVNNLIGDINGVLATLTTISEVE